MKWTISASAPAARAASVASRTASSSSGVTTAPAASIRSATSKRRSRGTIGAKWPTMPHGLGRVRRPSSSVSRKPRVVMRAQRTPLRSSTALVPTVVPWTTVSNSCAVSPSAARPAMKPSDWSAGVDGTLATRMAPEA